MRCRCQSTRQFAWTDHKLNEHERFRSCTSYTHREYVWVPVCNTRSICHTIWIFCAAAPGDSTSHMCAWLLYIIKPQQQRKTEHHHAQRRTECKKKKEYKQNSYSAAAPHQFDRGKHFQLAAEHHHSHVRIEPTAHHQCQSIFRSRFPFLLWRLIFRFCIIFFSLLSRLSFVLLLYVLFLSPSCCPPLPGCAFTSCVIQMVKYTRLWRMGMINHHREFPTHWRKQMYNHNCMADGAVNWVKGVRRYHRYVNTTPLSLLSMIL